MKKLLLAMLAVSVITFSSCSDDDDDKPQPGENFNTEDFKGEIKSGENVTLDASKTYKLTGKLIVKTGGKLTIPAGTVIEATTPSSGDTDIRYIAVEQGAQIFINGTASAPVVMTSTKKEAEAWGGLVVCGYAPTNKSSGSAAAEVSGLTYGGDKPADNSGKIEYLRLEYTGYKYTDKKEFNGLSLFGVGSGTTIDYVVSYKGGDDGIEFFGGTVNASHLVSVDSGDDGIDFADGWKGTGEYWVSLNSAKSGIEGSNNEDNGEATPMTTATLKNITVYGMGEKPFYLKEGAGMQTIDNIVIGGLNSEKKQAYFYADAKDKDAAAHARIAAGDIKVSNVNFVDVSMGQTAGVEGLTIQENIEANGAGNGINKPDWMPDALNTINGTTTVFGDPVKARVILDSDITSEITLDANNTYVLDGAVIVKKGGKLTIPAGTVIEASEVTPENTEVRYLAVEQGAQIFINGTANAPVVMTCAKREAEAWGGLVVCGYAPTNKSSGSAAAEVSGLTYGGDKPADNSGKIEYLRLEYTGYKYTDKKEFNGLSLFGVGSGTTIDYVVSYKGGDDGIEFFGGTVNASHLVSVDSGDDGIDFADGWKGTGEYWVSLNSAKSGIEGSNNEDNGEATPMTTATLKNITVYGMGEKPFYLKEGAGMQTIDNIVIGGLAENKAHAYFYADAKDKDAAAHARIAAGDIKVSNVNFVDVSMGQTAGVEGLTIQENIEANGAGNGINKPDWMPDALNTINGTTTVFGDPVKARVILDSDITSEITLDANNTYVLDGAVIVKKGGKLTIPAGTVIEASEVTPENTEVRYLAVEQGAQIFINGTANAPVVMTCAKREAEAWGGLVVCGYAPTNKSSGSAAAEVSGLTYGGDKPADNSGKIEYLRLEYTGYKYTDKKEFNGLSLFGVGSGTTIDYVVSYKGGDDGIEFFGGTVNASHLVSVDSGDDGIDFADGWKGTGEYWVSLNSAKSGIEGSNNEDNGEATPMTTATLKNITVYGMGEKPFYLKEGAGMQTIDNIVIGGLAENKAHAYFYADAKDKDAATHARIIAGDIKVTNVKFIDMGAGNTVKAVTGLTVTENENATGAGNGKDKPSWLSDALNTSYSGTTIIK